MLTIQWLLACQSIGAGFVVGATGKQSPADFMRQMATKQRNYRAKQHWEGLLKLSALRWNSTRAFAAQSVDGWVFSLATAQEYASVLVELGQELHTAEKVLKEVLEYTPPLSKIPRQGARSTQQRVVHAVALLSFVRFAKQRGRFFNASNGGGDPAVSHWVADSDSRKAVLLEESSGWHTDIVRSTQGGLDLHVERCDIFRINATDLDTEEFESAINWFRQQSVPVVVQGLISDWPAHKRSFLIML